jgi:MoxR-like ATPase
MNSGLEHIRDTLASIKSRVQSEIIGQDALIDRLLITIFAGGHALLEWVPGLGKTRTIRTLARVLALDTGRVSFTPDLLPSDLTGNEIYKAKEGKFQVRKWPIFTQILLADEINRTPPKVQSALLEAMEEKKVTIGDETLTLPSPFIVFATQNSLEHEGTYPLPEAQLDRFLMKVVLNYPSQVDEKKIFIQETSGEVRNEKWEKITITWDDILEMIDYIAGNIRVDERIYDYVSDILTSLRALAVDTGVKPSQHSNTLAYWPSTRAGLALIRAGRVHALMADRDYMIPEDIKSLAHEILDHRIGLTYESMSQGLTPYIVTKNTLEQVRIP